MTPELRAAKLTTQLAVVDPKDLQKRRELILQAIREAEQAAREDEREECAYIAETAASYPDVHKTPQRAANVIATAIRQRGTQQE